MASVVPGFEHDVFVSYATVDNRPENDPWVAQFVKTLAESLHAAIGTPVENRIWWDRKDIDEEAPLTDQIRSKSSEVGLHGCHHFAVMPTRTGARRSVMPFLQKIRGSAKTTGRCFLVDIGNLPEAERPAEFREIRGRHF